MKRVEWQPTPLCLGNAMHACYGHSPHDWRLLAQLISLRPLHGLALQSPCVKELGEPCSVPPSARPHSRHGSAFPGYVRGIEGPVLISGVDSCRFQRLVGP